MQVSVTPPLVDSKQSQQTHLQLSTTASAANAAAASMSQSMQSNSTTNGTTSTTSAAVAEALKPDAHAQPPPHPPLHSHTPQTSAALQLSLPVAPLPTTPTIPGQIPTITPGHSPVQPSASPSNAQLAQQQQPQQQQQSTAGAASAPAAATNRPNAPASCSSSSSKSVRRVGKYQLGRTLGQGTFGKVKVGIDTETGRHVAIKMMDKAKIRASNMGEQIKKEVSEKRK